MHLKEHQVEGVNIVFTLLTKNPYKHYNIEDLSTESRLDRTILQHAFKFIHGCTLNEFQTRQRLGRSQDLLLNSRKEIKVIAHLCGYDNPNSFSRAFSRQFGLSPRNFRKMQADNSAKLQRFSAKLKNR